MPQYYPNGTFSTGNTVSWPQITQPTYAQPIPATGTTLMTPTTPLSNTGSLMTIFVTGEDEVKNYPVAPGLTVMLISFNLQKFWLKSTSTNGVPEALREFSFNEKQSDSTKIQNGVSREEFDSLKEKIDKLIDDLGGK